MPVGDQVVRNPKEPGGERNALHLVTMQVAQRLKERSRSQILRVRNAPGPVVHVIIDLPNVALVEYHERLPVAAGSNRQDFVRFPVYHSKPGSFRWDRPRAASALSILLTRRCVRRYARMLSLRPG